MRAALAFAAFFAGLSSAMAQSADVTFFVIGKHANYSHVANGPPAPIDFSFFSEIFLTGNGDASDATLTFPGGDLEPFRDMRLAEGGDRDNLFLVSGEDRFTAAADLTARYPDGRYGLSFDTPSGAVDAQLVFQPRPLPRPPSITVKQNGKRCDSYDPDSDLNISWSTFENGRADPNGILDDLIFVILTNEEGVRVAHSGRPFENRPYLTYANSAFVIEHAALLPEQSYELSVEHALLDDTTEFDGVPGFTTRAVTTKRMIRTSAGSATDCGE